MEQKRTRAGDRKQGIFKAWPKYGRKSGNGERYYDEMRSLVEVSDVVYTAQEIITACIVSCGITCSKLPVYFLNDECNYVMCARANLRTT